MKNVGRPQRPPDVQASKRLKSVQASKRLLRFPDTEVAVTVVLRPDWSGVSLPQSASSRRFRASRRGIIHFFPMHSRSRLAHVALIAAFWTVIGLAFATSTWASYTVKGAPITVREAAVWSFTEWYLWGALAPAVFWLARRFPLRRESWRESLPWHVAGWLAVTVLWSMGYMTVERALVPYAGMAPTWGDHLVLYLTKKPAFTALVYAVMAGTAHALDLYRASAERERRSARLEAQLARSQLDALRHQLQPHFLFNTLHTITALVRRDPAAAERVVARLSDLLRLSLQTQSQQEVALRQEVEFLDHYVDIQRTRFPDRLAFAMDVPADTLDGLVPTLLLQPLVENAVKHGIEPHATAGNISVRARRTDGRLLLEVSDDGPGFNGGRDGGIGLSNTRERLKQLYGDDHTFRLDRCPEGGARVVIDLPWKTEIRESGIGR